MRPKTRRPRDPLEVKVGNKEKKRAQSKCYGHERGWKKMDTEMVMLNHSDLGKESTSVGRDEIVFLSFASVAGWLMVTE